MNTLRLAWRQLRRDLVAGEIRILLAALVLAVVAVSSVGFVTDRAGRALAIEANRLLGGDVVVRGDAPIGGTILEAAKASGLRSAQTTELNTMIRVGRGEDAQLRLGDLRALGAGFPLRGSFTLVDAAMPGEHAARGIPARGTLWMTRAGADTLGAKLGDRVSLGDATLTLVALVTQEPDAALDYFNVAPKVFLNADDLPATGLVQLGSRIGYRLVVAGDAGAVERFTATAREALGRGQRLETIQDARPEVRSALDRASRFLGLAALVSVILAAVAVAMAARRHSERHLSGVAVMRCLGAQQSRLVGIHVGELVLLGLIACTVGVAIAFALQWAIGGWLAQALKVAIPPAGWLPVLRGYGVGLVVLLAFGAPPVLALRRVPALRVLRRDLDPTEPSAWLVGLAGLIGLGALLWWQAGSATLGLAMLAGIAATLAVLAGLALLLILAVRRLRRRLRGALRYGLANVSRRAGTSIAQIAALGLGLMALLLLTFVRTDLLNRWQVALQADAPNRFIINVQDDQVPSVSEFIARQGLGAPTLFPMVRGRLVTHNGEATSGARYADEEARRRAEREFNLSTAATLREDNKVTAGRFWGAAPTSGTELSVEEGFAEQLGWKLGDTVSFDIAGQTLEGRITSLRKVDWESFKPNFFVLVSPGVLQDYAASHITAVRVPPDHPRFTAQLVQAFPNLSVIDIDQVLTQVRSTADQVSTVVQVVFWFSLAAGLLVLMAAVSASQDERLLEGGVMRVLGGSRRQLRAAQASEFAAIGLLSGLVAAIAASVLSGVVAVRVFDLPWQPNWTLAVVGGALGMLAALIAGLIATRKVLDAPPSVTLRELQG
ncbi:ABC transporter permease [Pseudoxanthomonas winnipegensis]|uniref:FtsX-like permease family protein n=1 Tax=Pseudoxanthomonas winnipegensis TaxID=2480810 RepID=A0A4V6MKV7_9GAMM|nr:FtsX-like permease family protein [Pseudoxanthomonas winnipegensis]RZZ88082.1 FtsX-like permease family protein [Pseudoxanthomonas winnipegensis]TAA34365.1 FtsX-like permease family protein [Pseudoxanthomonas winnipegensis]